MNMKIRVFIHLLVLNLTPKFLLRRLAKCQDVARWIADSEKLSFSQRVELFFHKLYCPPCHVYDQQLKHMHNSFIKLFKKHRPDVETHIDRLCESVIDQHSKK